MRNDNMLTQTEKETQSPGWLDQFLPELERDPDYVAEYLALHIAEEATELMEQKGISRSQLASLMGVSKAYVTRILNAPPNLTLRSIAALALALETRPHASILPTCSASERPTEAAAEESPANLR